MHRNHSTSDSRHYLDWLDFAEKDLYAALILKKEEDGRHAAAFHCQQCIEKALKAYVLSKSGSPVDGHNLTWLCRQAMKYSGDFKQWLDESAFLNRYYIQTRYPSDIEIDTSEKVVENAFVMAENMFNYICTQLHRGENGTGRPFKRREENPSFA